MLKPTNELHNEPVTKDQCQRIPIKQELIKLIPFGALKSRNVAAIVLSYAEDRERIYELMQTISHSTRAYITNAEGLKGFLVFGIPELVLKAPE